MKREKPFVVWREFQMTWWSLVPAIIADIRKVGFRDWWFHQRLGRRWFGINYEADECAMCEVYDTEIAEVTAENVRLRARLATLEVAVIEYRRMVEAPGPRNADEHEDWQASMQAADLALHQALDAPDARASSAPFAEARNPTHKPHSGAG